MIVRTAKCTVCGTVEEETNPGSGWKGWMLIQGIAIDGDEQVMLCPTHMAEVAEHLDRLKQEYPK